MESHKHKQSTKEQRTIHQNTSKLEMWGRAKREATQNRRGREGRPGKGTGGDERGGERKAGKRSGEEWREGKVKGVEGKEGDGFSRPKSYL